MDSESTSVLHVFDFPPCFSEGTDGGLADVGGTLTRRVLRRVLVS